MNGCGDIAYLLPCKPGSVYINITAECLNNCLFCIRRDGPIFFGYDLSLDVHEPNPKEIINSLIALNSWSKVNEVVFCGMGEPMLRYDCVMSSCKHIRELRGEVRLRIDTSGLFWNCTKRLEILEWIDILSISLNAENAEKYQELCRPRINNAFGILMDFLEAVKEQESKQKHKGGQFPEVRLSIVDTSEEEFIPASGRQEFPLGKFPVPDFLECGKIASTFGWPLIIKRLFRDSRDVRWRKRDFEQVCASGITLDFCKACNYRH